MVIEMVPGSYKQTPSGAPLFALCAFGGRPWQVGKIVDRLKAAVIDPKAMLFTLSLRRTKGDLEHYTHNKAREMWGFHEREKAE